MALQIIEFDNWIGHDLGRTAPGAYHYGRRKLLKSYSFFRGLNVMRYLNGAVGPRPPFQALNMPLLGPAQGAPPNPGWNGNFFTALWVGGLRRIVLIMDNGDVFVSSGSGGVIPLGTYPATFGWYYIGRLSFTPGTACVNGDNIFVGGFQNQTPGNPATNPAAMINPAAVTITNLTGVPACNKSVAYQQFIVVGLAANPAASLAGSSVIWFSDIPANISDLPGQSWTSATGNNVGVVGVGTAEAISGLFTQKDTLVISKQGGEWWTLVGIPSGPPTIRRLDVGLDFKVVGAAIRQSNIWYPNGRDIGTFTGTAVLISALPDLDDFGGSSKYTYGTFNGITSLVNPDEFMLTATGTRYNGQNVPWVFIHHGLEGTGTSPGWSRHVLDYRGLGGSFVASSNIPLHVGDGVVWLFLQAQPNLQVDVFQFDVRSEIPYQRVGPSFPPGNPAALYQDLTDITPVAGEFSIPEWWAPDGHNAGVQKVFV
ncbi:MAG: hypothetical protein ACREQ5_03730, partial [Candidatus Dormibacteria bacterium]